MLPAVKAPARTALKIRDVRAVPHELRFTVETAGREHELWARTSLPVVPGADVAVALTFTVAMAQGGRLEVDAPVDETLVRWIGEIEAVLRIHD